MIYEDNKPYGLRASTKYEVENEIPIYVQLNLDFTILMKDLDKDKAMECYEECVINLRNRLKEKLDGKG